MMKSKILGEEFFDRPTLTVARELIGKRLCRRIGRRCVKLPIMEVEAYDGVKDKASHAHRGITKRNAVMFGPAGYWYVYLCYGIHWLLNIVTGPREYPAAILIRGAGEYRGPGRLTKALEIDKSHDRLCAKPHSGLWVEEGALRLPSSAIVRKPRIGVDYAGLQWSRKPYRFSVLD